jgi:predicted nucleic-acid-binding protein
VRAVDTNVLARLVLADDHAQCDMAAALLDTPAWITATVWLELGWVLGKRLDRPRACDALAGVLAMESVHTFDSDGLTWAIDRYRAGADWADVIHLISARGIADSFTTFDRDIGRRVGDTPPLPIETLA